MGDGDDRGAEAQARQAGEARAGARRGEGVDLPGSGDTGPERLREIAGARHRRRGRLHRLRPGPVPHGPQACFRRREAQRPAIAHAARPPLCGRAGRQQGAADRRQVVRARRRARRHSSDLRARRPLCRGARRQKGSQQVGRAVREGGAHRPSAGQLQSRSALPQGRRQAAERVPRGHAHPATRPRRASPWRSTTSPASTRTAPG